MSVRLNYALITPARDEVTNLRRLGASVVEQELAPVEWLIVDDGSTDGTDDVARSLAASHSWIRVLDSPGRVSRVGPLEDGRAAGRDVVAFNTALELLRQPVDVIVKLDADVSFQPDFFARLLGEFEADPRLGIASGTCFEEDGDVWIERRVARSHVRGATRAWRMSCLRDVGPLVERLGWDIVDEMKARSLGWDTRPIESAAFFHHRSMGARDGQGRAWSQQGEIAHYVGYRPLYLIARSLHHARRDLSALRLISGYAAALAARGPRHPDLAVRYELRRRQRLRDLPARAREVVVTGRG